MANGDLKAPIVISRGKGACGTVPSPFHEIEGNPDGSEARSPSMALNALINSAPGASWVSCQYVGSEKIGFAMEAEPVMVADGSPARR